MQHRFKGRSRSVEPGARRRRRRGVGRGRGRTDGSPSGKERANERRDPTEADGAAATVCRDDGKQVAGRASAAVAEAGRVSLFSAFGGRRRYVCFDEAKPLRLYAILILTTTITLTLLTLQRTTCNEIVSLEFIWRQGETASRLVWRVERFEERHSLAGRYVMMLCAGRIY